MTALGMLMHIRINLWFLLIPTISMSLMCLYTKQAMKYESCNSFTIFEKGLLVLLVVFLCSGVVDCSIYEYGIRRLTHFYMASMFYKMLGGWILAELVLCRRFPLALIKYFFLIVLVVNVVRFIGFSYRPFYTYQDGIYYLIQIAITFVVLPYMYCRCHYAHKERNK